MNFIGNSKVVDFLRKSLERGRVNHAYLFSGPQSVGKLTLAKIFAQALIDDAALCMDVEYQSKDGMLDLLVIAPEVVEKKEILKKRDISIEKVREAQKSLSLFPYHGKHKVLIIEDAHRMNNSAQNALLKLLEEPNQTSILILVTHEIDRILPTVQSRCEKINFSLVGETEITAAFGAGDGYVADLASLAMGRPGIAKLILEKKAELELRRQAKQQLHKLREGSIGEKLQLAEDFSKDVTKTLDVLNVWIWSLRDDALSSGNETNRNGAYQVIEKIQQSMTLLKSTNANGRLLLEALFMDI